MHKSFVVYLALASCLLAATAVAQESADAARPNIILCMTDDQGWGDVSYNGLKDVQTPNLDAMAAAGLRFNRFYAAAPVCSPTRGSVLTGRHPNRYGCFLYGYPLKKEETTLAQVLQAAGYTTGHFGKWHLNGVSGPGKPIPADDPLHPGRFGFDQWFSVSNFFDLNTKFSRNGQTVQFEGDGSDVIVEEALGFIAAAVKKEQPFLAVIWFGNPHNPHQALPKDVEAAGGSHYYGEIVGIDRSLGTLRGGLRKLKVADNTLVWFCSDNGATGPGSTGGLRGKKGSVWEGGVRVPGIVEWPARIKPGVTDVPACTSDIFPTIVELTGANVERPVKPLDGISLQPLLSGQMNERPQPIGFWHFAPKAQKPVELSPDAGQRAWTDNRYKLVKAGGGGYELYDVTNDPQEARNIAADHPQIVQRMKGELAQWQASVVRSFQGQDYESKP